MEAQGHRAISGTRDRLTCAGEQLKSGSASHSVMREDNCGMAVRGSEWAIIGCHVRYARIRWGECIQVEQNVVMLLIVDLIL
ncbi:Uncharacterized protein HZ326_24248 [Fusarium oxysporum f. sp. albedinis]|nr:Uncharacterized protein HZ326_24248 [Fusarium oxysporum f. sp. albedinis]